MPNFQKNSCLKQATQQNTCQILLPQKTRNRKFQTLSLSLEIRSIPPPPPLGDLNGWFRAVQGVKTTLTSHRGKPVLVSRLNKSFLLMSKNACFSCWMLRFGCAVSKYSKSRMVGLKSAYCSKRLITFTSTFSSLEKCFQLGISLISLSRNSAICSIRSGFIVKTSDNKDPFKNKKCSCDQ